MQTAKDRFLYLLLQESRREFMLFENLTTALKKAIDRFKDLMILTVKRVKKELLINLENGRCSKDVFIIEQSELFDFFLALLASDRIEIANRVISDLKEGGLY